MSTLIQRLTPRRAVRETVLRQVVAVLVALALVVAIVAATGFDAPAVVSTLAGAYVNDQGNVLRWATPLILTGLATCVAFRARVYNIGFDGQLFVGAAVGAAVSLRIVASVPGVLGIPVILAAATLAGALWAGIAGVLRVRWGAPEIITTVILIDVARLLVQYLALGPLAGGSGLAAAQSSDIVDRALWLPNLPGLQQASIGLVISLTAAFLIAFLVYRTRVGYELKLFGQNPRFTFYGGVDNPRVFMRAMLISGALSGLAGGIEVLGTLHRLPSEFASGLGFQGIAVSLVAANNPIAIVVSGLFFGGLRAGGTSLRLLTETPREIVDVVSALVILAISARFTLSWRRRRSRPASSDLLTTREGP